MDKQLKKALEAHLATLEDYQSRLFDEGHTFWYCDAQDAEKGKPFYYYQTNRTQHMGTCSTCYKLIENRKKIRAIEKQLGIEITPLHTNHTEENHVKRIIVRGGGNPEYNPNVSYAGMR